MCVCVIFYDRSVNSALILRPKGDVVHVNNLLEQRLLVCNRKINAAIVIAYLLYDAIDTFFLRVPQNISPWITSTDEPTACDTLVTMNSAALRWASRTRSRLESTWDKHRSGPSENGNRPSLTASYIQFALVFEQAYGRRWKLMPYTSHLLRLMKYSSIFIYTYLLLE